MASYYTYYSLYIYRSLYTLYNTANTNANVFTVISSAPTGEMSGVRQLPLTNNWKFSSVLLIKRLIKKHVVGSLSIKIIDCIVKMRYFIHDLHNQLAQLQSLFIESINGRTNLTLYRSQIMKNKELDEIRENSDSFITMNSFFY